MRWHHHQFALHCHSWSLYWRNPHTSDVTIRVVSNTLDAGTQYAVESITCDPKFTHIGSRVDDDIAHVKLTSDIQFSDSVKAAGLVDATIAPGTKAYLLGWGKTETSFPNTLREEDLDIISLADCRSELSDTAIHVTGRNMCTFTSGKSPRNGDSGSPLVVNGKLAGVSSTVYGCGSAKYPSAYTDVGNKNIRDFIRDTAGVRAIWEANGPEKASE